MCVEDRFELLPSSTESDQSDEKNDFNNFGDQKADDEKEAKQEGASEKIDEKSDEQKSGSPEQYGSGAGGEPAKKLLKAVTDQSYEDAKAELLDKKSKGFTYGNLPDA